MPNKKKKKSSGSKKSKTQPHPTGNPSDKQPSQASASSHSRPSTTATDQPTRAGSSSTAAGPPTKATYKGLRFPADGSPPVRISYATIPPSGEDQWLDIAPDFSPYWNGDYETRKLQVHHVADQEIVILDGYYISYYSRNLDLPVNKTLLSMPPVRTAVDKSIAQGEKFEERLFWRGDVFVCRMREPFENDFKAKYDDISPQLVGPLSELLADGFAYDWEAKNLERYVQDDAYFEDFRRKYESNEEDLATAMGLYVSPWTDSGKN
jgi:hypothetical protein